MSGNKRQLSTTESYESSTKKTAFDFEKHIDVDIESFGITYSTITTNAVSSCHFILIDGEFEGQQFSYLSHSSIECEEESGDIDTTLAEAIDQTVENFEEHNESNEGSQILIDKIKINKILVGGDVDDNINLIPKLLLLLNDMEFNTEKMITNKFNQRLYRESKGNILVIRSITYFFSDDEDNEGENHVITNGHQTICFGW
ncbi:unnamed protein product [Adineta steineri]|uniref:Uncharacterized protein n=1 Tax=Adineta steineri TaxID=433720 RepID=A0A818UJW1_9BILA|nr:unnamed protein product [Adineta steineri]